MKARALTCEDVLLLTRRKYGFTVTDVYGKCRIFMIELTWDAVKTSKKDECDAILSQKSLSFYRRKMKSYPSDCNVRPLIKHVRSVS